ncbi:hypothetical protein LIER_08761 [Lithospermum erythrorhizon]
METDESTQALADVTLGRGMRTRVPSVRLWDFVVNTLSIPRPPPTTTSSSSHLPSGNGNFYSLSDVMDSSRFSLEHRIFLAVVATDVEPRSFTEAMQDPGWREAMHTEIRALESNET